MTDPMQMSKMITGAWISQMIYAAAKLNLADRLHESPKTADELAAETETHPRSLFRLLRGLESVGIFRFDGEAKLHLTPLAETLRSDVPGSQRALAIMMGEEHFRCWGELLYSVRTGETAFDHIYGKPIFEYLSEHPEAAANFDAAMTSVHGRESAPMARAYDFGRFKTLADVGGGNGSLLITILQHYPNLKGVLYDLPGVVERTRGNIADAGLSDRCEVVAGSFFESIPTGADAYLMRHIIHDWNDERCGAILKNFREAMTPEATLLIAESVIPTDGEPFFGKMLDLTMLLLPGGQERTEQEYRELLAANGFEMTGLVPTETEVSFVEARVAS